MNERVNRAIHALTTLELKKGDRVGILAYNCPQYFEVFTLSRVGLISVPLNYRAVGKELTYFINDSEIKVLILEKEFLDRVRSVHSEIPCVRYFICLDGHPGDMLSDEEMVAREPASRPRETASPEDPCILFYTSGTTGRPKGAIHTQKSILAETRVPYRDLDSDDVALCVMPFFHVGGSAAHLFPAYAVGATLVIQKKFDETLVLKAFAEQKVTHVYLVPAMIMRVLEHLRLGEYDLRSLRTIAYTRASMPIEVLKQGIAKLGSVFIQFLGQTESLDMTVLRKHEHRLSGTVTEMRRLESAGRPPSDGELRIVDEQGQEVAPGQVGEIVARSDRMMKVYWKSPEETAETIQDGWLHTGDLAKMDEDGYVYIVDRKKDVIISGAENIYSREIEEVLHIHPAVLEAAVVGVPDLHWGESVKAIVVLKPGVAASEQEIIEFCKGYLASYKKPRSVEFWDALPRTGSGKVRKNKIRERFWQGHSKRVH